MNEKKHNLGELVQTYILELEAKISEYEKIMNMQKNLLDAKQQIIGEYAAHKTHCEYSKGSGWCDCGFDGIKAVTIDDKIVPVENVTTKKVDISPTPRIETKYRYCNHHHELTDSHELVDFGSGVFVANKEAIPLLKALNDIGLKTRSHHVDGNINWVAILLDNVAFEIKEVFERDADRTEYNGKKEILIKWTINQPTKET